MCSVHEFIVTDQYPNETRPCQPPPPLLYSWGIVSLRALTTPHRGRPRPSGRATVPCACSVPGGCPQRLPHAPHHIGPCTSIPPHRRHSCGPLPTARGWSCLNPRSDATHGSPKLQHRFSPPDPMTGGSSPQRAPARLSGALHLLDCRCTADERGAYALRAHTTRGCRRDDSSTYVPCIRALASRTNTRSCFRARENSFRYVALPKGAVCLPIDAEWGPSGWGRTQFSAPQRSCHPRPPPPPPHTSCVGVLGNGGIDFAMALASAHHWLGHCGPLPPLSLY